MYSNIFLASVSALAVALSLTHARAEDASKPLDTGLENESELGIVINSGNSDAQSYNVKQTSTYSFSDNLFKLSGHFLRATANDLTSALNWDLGLRYERALSERVAAYVGQNVEADVFAGYLQRYNSDVGAKYSLMKTEDFYWNVEGGYRLSVQNDTTFAQSASDFARIYTEANRSWNKRIALKYWLEALPELSSNSAYRLNTELSLTSALTSFFSIKTAYGIRYNSQPADSAPEKTDSTFTTSFVTKF